MKLPKILLSFCFAACASLSFGAHAESCSWDQYSLSGSNGTWDAKYLCRVGTSTKATKVVTVKSKGAPKCSLNVVSGYKNSGNCTTPNITKSAASCPTINIGMSCSGQNWCAEAFGRTCYAAGGTTIFNGGQMVCKTKC